MAPPSSGDLPASCAPPQEAGSRGCALTATEAASGRDEGHVGGPERPGQVAYGPPDGVVGEVLGEIVVAVDGGPGGTGGIGNGAGQGKLKLLGEGAAALLPSSMLCSNPMWSKE